MCEGSRGDGEAEACGSGRFWEDADDAVGKLPPRWGRLEASRSVWEGPLSTLFCTGGFLGWV